MKVHKHPLLRGLASASVLCAAAALSVVGDVKPAQASPFGVGVQVRIGDFRIGARYDDRDYRGGYRYPNPYPCPESYPYPVAVPAPYPYAVPAPCPEVYPNTYPYSVPAPYPSAYPYPAPVPYAYPVPAPYPAYPYAVGGRYGRDRNDCDDWRYRRR